MIKSFSIRHMHIELGERGSETACPLALALSELFPLCNARVYISEGKTFMELTRKDNGRQIVRQVPAALHHWLAHFDEQGWMPEHTFRMELTAGEWELISPALSS